MKKLASVSIVLWLATGVALLLGHPIGFTLAILGLTAAITMAYEAPAEAAVEAVTSPAVGPTPWKSSDSSPRASANACRHAA